MTKLNAPLAMAHGPEIANRLVLAPLTNFQSNDDGTLADAEYDWLMSRAGAGFGMTFTCAAYVQQNGKGFAGQLGASGDVHMAGLSRLAAGIRKAGSVSCLQLQHSGLRADKKFVGDVPVSAFADKESGSRALTTTEVEQLIEDFIAAAVRGEKAGFDGVEIHGAHGYLLTQFLDGTNNLRSDRYGGAFENRTRILFEIINGIRSRTGAAFQLGLRLSPERWGVTLPESLALAEQMLGSGKLDYLDMSLWDVFKTLRQPEYAGKTLLDLFAALPRHQTKLGVAGKILSAATAQACLDGGADFVLVGRGAILHRDFAKLAMQDAAFEAVKLPVTRDYLTSQNIGPIFANYLATQWPDFVSKEA